MFGLKIIRNQNASSQRTCLRAFHRFGNTHLNKELTKAESSDSILQGIKSAVHTLDLLDVLAKNEKPLNPEQVMQSLRSVFTLQKSENLPIQKSEIISHPQFEQLLRDLRRNCRTFGINDIIETLKVLSYIGVPANSNITHVLLNLLRRQINDVTLGHIVFLDFLLQKFDRTPLVEALQIALPMIFQLQLQSQIDHENVAQLTDLLYFASRHRIANQGIMNIVSALTLQGTNLNFDEARSIIWSLCDLHQFKSTYEKLLENCFSVLNKDYKSLSFNNIEITLFKLTEKLHNYKYNEFYNEEFYNTCASYAIEFDVGFENAMYLLKKFNKVDFVSIALLDYVAEKANELLNHLENAKLHIYFNFISAFSNAHYIPKQWETLKSAILSHHILKSDRTDLPWLKVACELNSLDCYNKDLLDKILSNDFLDIFLSREQNKSNYSELLLLHQSVLMVAENYSGNLPSSKFINKAIELNLQKNDFPLKSSLEQIFGGSTKICTKVTTKHGHLIDHIIVFDQNNEPISISTEDIGDFRYMEEFQCDNYQIIGILTFPKSHYALNFPRLKGKHELAIKSLEALGVCTIAVNIKQWTEMPDKEKLPYLEHEIKQRLQKTNAK